MSSPMMDRVARGRDWLLKTTAYETKVNKDKDRTLRGKARRKARRKR